MAKGKIKRRRITVIKNIPTRGINKTKSVDDRIIDTLAELHNLKRSDAIELHKYRNQLKQNNNGTL